MRSLRLIGSLRIVLVAGWFLAACTGEPGRIAVPTTSAEESATSMAAELRGELQGDPTTGCVWVAGEAGGQASRVTVLWPRGYTAEFHPLRLLDAEGEVVARGGDTIELAGGVVSSAGVCGGAQSTFKGSRPTVVR